MTQHIDTPSLEDIPSEYHEMVLSGDIRAEDVREGGCDITDPVIRKMASQEEPIL